MAITLLENMSKRIRRLDNALYKTEQFVRNKKLKEFKIPEEYSFSHAVAEPSHDMMYIEPVNADCPICGKSITVLNLKKQIMSTLKQTPDGRIRYKECDPLWFDVWSCPYCHYSNHYLSFFKMLPFKRDLIRRVLKEQHDPVLAARTDLTSPFDQLFRKYIQTIHINEAVNSNDELLIGRLWLDLYWLFEDAADDTMKLYCARKAAALLASALEKGVIDDKYALQSMQMSLANIYSVIGDRENAVKMCDLVIEGENGQLKKYAYTLMDADR